MNLDLSSVDREILWKHLQDQVERFYTNTAQLEVAPALNQKQVQQYIHQSAQSVSSPLEALEHIEEGMTRFAVHTPHPQYFGLFNPRAAFTSVVADTITLRACITNYTTTKKDLVQLVELLDQIRDQYKF